MKSVKLCLFLFVCDVCGQVNIDSDNKGRRPTLKTVLKTDVTETDIFDVPDNNLGNEKTTAKNTGITFISSFSKWPSSAATGGDKTTTAETLNQRSTPGYNTNSVSEGERRKLDHFNKQAEKRANKEPILDRPPTDEGMPPSLSLSRSLTDGSHETRDHLVVVTTTDVHRTTSGLSFKQTTSGSHNDLVVDNERTSKRLHETSATASSGTTYEMIRNKWNTNVEEDPENQQDQSRTTAGYSPGTTESSQEVAEDSVRSVDDPVTRTIKDTDQVAPDTTRTQDALIRNETVVFNETSTRTAMADDLLTQDGSTGVQQIILSNISAKLNLSGNDTERHVTSDTSETTSHLDSETAPYTSSDIGKTERYTINDTVKTPPYSTSENRNLTPDGVSKGGEISDENTTRPYSFFQKNVMDFIENSTESTAGTTVDVATSTDNINKRINNDTATEAPSLLAENITSSVGDTASFRQSTSEGSTVDVYSNDTNDVVFVSTICKGCMKCICLIEGCEKNIGICVMEGSSLRCGPYKLEERYWLDCGRPGQDFQSCTKTMECSERCIQTYHSSDRGRCTRTGHATCRDYVRIQKAGLAGCSDHPASDQPDLETFWNQVNLCCQARQAC